MHVDADDEVERDVAERRDKRRAEVTITNGGDVGNGVDDGDGKASRENEAREAGDWERVRGKQ